jgi:hypothetical protein
MTIDMTQNRVPYGLLTDGEKAALHEHENAGGVFAYYWGSGWISVGTVMWNEYNIYRTVPLPKTQDVIAWERLPAWVQWVAREVDGDVYAYDEEPECRANEWRFGGSECIRIDYWPGIVQIGTADWKDSKQRRPRG